MFIDTEKSKEGGFTVRVRLDRWPSELDWHSLNQSF